MTLFFRVFVLFACILVLAASRIEAKTPSNNAYVGSATCSSCHEDYVASWKESDHFHAMAEANATTILGDFNNVTFDDDKIATRFYTLNNQFFIETPNEKGQKTQYQVLYTFGHFPLQQYLVHTGNGHVQAFSIAWDARPKKEGGQRWFDLQPDEAMDASSPFFWLGSFQNWNSRCAECHSTSLLKNYEPTSHRYATQWAEINVACESCHGPAKKHLELAKTKRTAKNAGFARPLPKTRQWAFSTGEAIASPLGEKSSAHIDMCGGCHSRRMALHEKEIAASETLDYHSTYSLQTLSEALYFADGQIKDEVYVLGSFLQSKMHAAGVSCTDCHNAHTGKLRSEPNAVCAQCHQHTVFDTQTHHGHEKNNTLRCIDCHMPQRTYMGVDPRRDHRFTIPDPQLSEDIGTPNACLSCHTQKDNAWAATQLKNLGKKPRHNDWPRLNKRLQRLDSLALQPLVYAISDLKLTPIIRASLAEHLTTFTSQEKMDAVKSLLIDENPMVRRGGVRALSTETAEVRWQFLASLLNDPSQSVRFDVVANLADINEQRIQMNKTDKGILKRALAEYHESLTLNADFPSTQLNLANLAIRQNKPQRALAAYKRALFLSPKYVPALINFADFCRHYRKKIDENVVCDEKPLLENALAVAPDSSAVQHAVGLFYIRQKHYQKALGFLKEATNDHDDASPRYSYVYAIALDNQGDLKGAIRALQRANKRWPNQYQILITLIAYLEKAKQPSLISKYLEPLRTLAPNAPQIRALVRKYAR